MQAFFLKVNSCGISDCRPEWHWDINGFNDYDLWTVFRGKGKLQVGDEILDVEEGVCLLLPPNTPIHGRHEKDKPLFVINVHFDFTQNNTPVFPYLLKKRFIVNLPFFKELLQRLLSAHYKGNESEAHSWLNVILTEFSSSPVTRENATTENSHAYFVGEICKQINENVKNSASLTVFAHKYGYSATYLGRIFHKLTGVTFSQYLSNARINQAKSFLLTSDLSVTEIAEQLGYYDPCHFIRHFQKIVGCSPNSYR